MWKNNTTENKMQGNLKFNSYGMFCIRLTYSSRVDLNRPSDMDTTKLCYRPKAAH